MSETKKPTVNNNSNVVKPTMEMQTVCNSLDYIPQYQPTKPVMQMQNAIKSITQNKSGK